jgi:hypothetical protein
VGVELLKVTVSMVVTLLPERVVAVLLMAMDPELA